MATETDVFAQISRLFTEEPINPVQLALDISARNRGVKFDDVLFTQTLPSSVALQLVRVAQRLRENDPDYYPDGLPTLEFNEGLEIENAEGLPLFWLRNNNIDIDSCWWNIFTENGGARNNRKTDFNDEYWHRDLDDPDIDRVPEEDFTLLSERFPEIKRDSDRTGVSYSGAYVPYEVVYPEWFKAHPEYVQLENVLSPLGISAKSILDSFRESEDSDQVDAIMLGNFIGMLPRTREDALYIHEFFKYTFRKRAFASALPKLQSPCVTHALETEGFFSQYGDSLGWINKEGNNLSQLKNNNYYYEYRVFEDLPPFVDDINVFTYKDVNEEFRLGYDADQIIIRKVKGKFKKNASHGEISALAGKGSYFPEFTAFEQAVYPTDPTQESFPYTVAQLEAFDDNVLDIHQDEFKGEIGDPQVYISIKKQK
jgi:hypothetical protein